MQSPSSLIFLVLLGVWAAYFAQYWLRRRDHLATARSVEQFSEAMRVLERRPALPRTDLSEPSPRSYAVHPARAARPQVIVKRAVAAEPVASGVTERISPEPRPASRASRVPDAGKGQGRRPRRDARRRVRPSRRLRGLILLASLVALMAVVPLVVLSILPLWAPAPAAAVVVVAFLWVRSAVRAERALSRAHRRRPAHRRASSRTPISDTASALDPPVVDGSVTAATAGDEAVAEAPDTMDAVEQAQPADAGLSTGPEAVAEVMVPIVDEDDIPLTWDPVPVPRPTYTMKAKAERPEVEPAATTPDPVRHDGNTGEDTAYDQRRVAGA